MHTHGVPAHTHPRHAVARAPAHSSWEGLTVCVGPSVPDCLSEGVQLSPSWEGP